MNQILLPQIAKYFLRISILPFILLAIGYGLNYGWEMLALKYKIGSKTEVDVSFYFINIIQAITLYWITFNFINLIAKHLAEWGKERNYPILGIIMPPILSSLEGVLLLVMLNMLSFTLQLSGELGLFVEKVSKVLLILTLAWIFYQVVSSLEKYITNRYIAEQTNFTASRKLHTQIILLKKVILFFIGLITFASIIMVFDSTRNLGTSLLTTAGIISAIGAFASQQSLGRIFAGLQLAFTQPVRIGDTVIIEKEYGQVEEISLSFITIKLWDLRHLILPTDTFIQKGVLNLTHDSTELLGTVFLYADFTLPIDEVRQTFFDLVEKSIYWNKKVASLEITDIKEHTMELRCLLSADHATNLWKLRCEIREALIKYIVNKHSDCLTKSRNLTLVPEC